MADSPQTPLLNPIPEQTQLVQTPKIENPEPNLDTHLEKSLQKLESFISVLGYNQSSVSSSLLSWALFLAIGVLVPVLVVEFSNCGDCEEYQIREFELDCVVSQACLGAVSLLCLSHNLRKYGIRKFLFVDRYSGQMVRFHDQYVTKISGCLRILGIWILPCLLLKVAREVAHILYVPRQTWWLSLLNVLAVVISWTYVTTVSLSASILFHLVCNLQVIHFEDFGKCLERESDVMVFIEEHIRLRYYLSKISHRFRIYLVLLFLVVTASQFVTLFETTGDTEVITILNGSDFVISSIVQVLGVTLCLNAAAKISHRAQGIASLASRWHAVATCAEGTNSRHSNSFTNLEAGNPFDSWELNYSESDLESLDYMPIPTNSQLANYMSSYHKRQAFVMYLQTNPGGITIFGCTVDRGLINTIFFIELSLILFVLGKTIMNASVS